MNFKMLTEYVDVPCKWTISTCSDMSEEERLKVENKELRKERDALDHLTDVLNDSNDGLLFENVKLRELIHDMNECIEHSSHNCDGCSLDKCKLYEFNCRMRELGVEV